MLTILKCQIFFKFKTCFKIKFNCSIVRESWSYFLLIPKQKWSWAGTKSAVNSHLKMWWETLYSAERWLPCSYLQNLLLLNKHLFIFQNEVFTFGMWCLSPQGFWDWSARFVWFCLEQNNITELECALHVSLLLCFFFFFNCPAYQNR